VVLFESGYYDFRKNTLKVVYTRYKREMILQQKM